MTAVIFDFNGTMFFDSDKHEQAWRRYLEQELGKRISWQTYQREVHGKDNADIVRYFWGAQVSAEEISRRSEEKESLYRELCLADKGRLSPGRRVTGISGCPSGAANARCHCDHGGACQCSFLF